MNTERNVAIGNLSKVMLSGAIEALSLSQEINVALMGAIDGISIGDEPMLQRAGLFAIRTAAGRRFTKLQHKVATHIGRRKAVIEVGNAHLQAHGLETVVLQADYGLSDCKADRDTAHTNTDWSDHMIEAWERLQNVIEAVEADVTSCQERLCDFASSDGEYDSSLAHQVPEGTDNHVTEGDNA